MPSRSQRFVTKILKQGPNPYVEVPAKVSKRFARYTEKGRIRVYGTLEDTEIRGNLVPRGDGHWLFLHAGMRVFAAVGVGDAVELALRAVPWDHVPIASDCKAALKKAGALTTFEAMSPSQRHELLRWIDVATSAGRRAKRLAATVVEVQGRLSSKKRQPARTRKPLWACPKCGHVFVNPNQWHSCKRYTLKQALSKGSPHVRRLFDRLRVIVSSTGPVRVQAYQARISILALVRRQYTPTLPEYHVFPR